AACSGATVGGPEETQTTSSGTSRAVTASPSTTQPARSAPPGAGAAISEVISWIEAGRPADPAAYHSATRDGQTTDLGDDIAFTAPPGPSGATSCMTDSGHAGGALACLVNLADPPPRPAEVYGEWRGNWVDFTGTTLQIGSAHGDPGPFSNGAGPELPSGASLSFGDYRCRTDRADLFCVNYAHRSATRFGSAGVEPFGCLHPVSAPPDVGKLFSC
ncbi:MAG TPA: hypothetical protein VFQ37_16735, partial [Mycobacterium sp.]|nr:hypothetical protein [Mycobacterium sp.]